MIFPKTTGQMKKLNFTEFKIMEDKFIKLKLSKLFQLQTNLVRSLELKNRCCMDLIEFFQED